MLTIKQMSILPLQSGVEFDTPKGRGTYEGITSSGIVKVFIDGEILEFPYTKVRPVLKLSHIIEIRKISRELTKTLIGI